MRIQSIEVYTAELRYAGEAYAFAGGRSYEAFTTTVVAVHTNAGETGYGETCPCGPAYMPAFAAGMPACLAQLAPAVVGADPRAITDIVRRMDAALAGHEAAKTAIDIACWDLLGKVCGVPVHTLLGGRLADWLPLHRIVPLAAPDTMRPMLAELRAQGFASFQVKLGHAIETDAALLHDLAPDFAPGEIRVGDANGAWRGDEALRFSRMVRDLDVYLEQPCADYDACAALRRRIAHPLKLDESLADVASVRRALREQAMDAAALKISRYGGLTRSRLVRDLCVESGVPMTIEDAWGGAIATAAYAHLAASTPPERLLNTTDLHNYNTTRIARGAPEVADGRMRVGDRPGLGVEPDFDVLGEPVVILDGTA